MTKATLRKNGLKMLTIEVSFNISRDHIVELIAYKLSINDDPIPKSRNDILFLVRYQARLNGNGLLHRSDEDVDRPSVEQYHQAADIVDKAFPDFEGK